MCNGCGKVPPPPVTIRAYKGLDTKGAVAAIQKERSFCPRCKKKMVLQPGGVWACNACGVTRR